MILNVIIGLIVASLGLSLYVFLLLALHYRKPRERRSMVPVTHVDILT